MVEVEFDFLVAPSWQRWSDRWPGRPRWGGVDIAARAENLETVILVLLIRYVLLVLHMHVLIYLSGCYVVACSLPSSIARFTPHTSETTLVTVYSWLVGDCYRFHVQPLVSLRPPSSRIQGIRRQRSLVAYGTRASDATKRSWLSLVRKHARPRYLRRRQLKPGDPGTGEI